MTFDCQMIILPLQLTVKQLGFLTVQFDAVSLGIWMLDNVCRHVGLDWTLGSLNFFARTKTLILTVLGGNCTVQSLRDFEA